MPTRDNTSNQQVVMVMNSIIVSDIDTPSAIIDTADFDMGVMFASAQVQLTPDGSYAFAISESDDSGMAGATVVGAEKIIESLPTHTVITATNTQWKVFGVHSTKRFLQITVTSTGVGSGAQVVVVAVMSGEYSPQLRA